VVVIGGSDGYGGYGGTQNANVRSMSTLKQPHVHTILIHYATPFATSLNVHHWLTETSFIH